MFTNYNDCRQDISKMINNNMICGKSKVNFTDCSLHMFYTKRINGEQMQSFNHHLYSETTTMICVPII